jgi:gliding motility-associated-like protein
MKYGLALICSLLFGLHSFALCIASFPYHEDFEASKGNWVSGGTSNDWAWGNPNKSKITNAAQGVNCWIAGGLSKATYNSGERSYVESPCFNFTNLSNPFIEFKIFIEAEDGFDGANFQYSINGGTTWINVGSANEPNGCYTQNWFNNASINYLNTLATVQSGWSGSSKATSGSCVGGGATGNWIQAKHCLKFLAGQPNVIFRFTFGAGTTCNTYDGFAFDDVYIQNAPRFTANFTSTCTVPGTFKFTDASTNCPSTWKWNFGDNTTSTATSPTHSYTNPGVYSVQLIASNTCAIPDTIELVVNVLSAIVSKSDVLCFGDSTGYAQVIVQGSNPKLPLNISWNTNPVQKTDSIGHLPAGSYTVIVSQGNTCSVSKTIVISQPPKLSHTFTKQPTSCIANQGAVSLNISGGIAPIQYQWLPNVSQTSTATQLAAGKYFITVTDAHQCLDTLTVWVDSESPNIKGFLDADSTNVFTPNGDGVNDDFRFLSIELKPDEYDWNIFNRWGQSVFHTKNYLDAWNGGAHNQTDVLPDGNYYYQLKLRYCGDIQVNKSGSIKIVR